LVLNINQNNADDYELWECKKADTVISYFLNKNPDTVDDEGTKRQRKRICELFRIKTINNEEANIKLIQWAHYEKDWCEKKLNENLTLNDATDFNCSKFEDLSFLFNN